MQSNDYTVIIDQFIQRLMQQRPDSPVAAIKLQGLLEHYEEVKKQYECVKKIDHLFELALEADTGNEGTLKEKENE